MNNETQILDKGYATIVLAENLSQNGYRRIIQQSELQSIVNQSYGCVGPLGGSNGYAVWDLSRTYGLEELQDGVNPIEFATAMHQKYLQEKHEQSEGNYLVVNSLGINQHEEGVTISDQGVYYNIIGQREVNELSQLHYKTIGGDVRFAMNTFNIPQYGRFFKLYKDIETKLLKNKSIKFRSDNIRDLVSSLVVPKENSRQYHEIRGRFAMVDKINLEGTGAQSVLEVFLNNDKPGTEFTRKLQMAGVSMIPHVTSVNVNTIPAIQFAKESQGETFNKWLYDRSQFLFNLPPEDQIPVVNKALLAHARIDVAQVLITQLYLRGDSNIAYYLDDLFTPEESRKIVSGFSNVPIENQNENINFSLYKHGFGGLAISPEKLCESSLAVKVYLKEATKEQRKSLYSFLFDEGSAFSIPQKNLDEIVDVIRELDCKFSPEKKVFMRDAQRHARRLAGIKPTE